MISPRESPSSWDLSTRSFRMGSFISSIAYLISFLRASFSSPNCAMYIFYLRFRPELLLSIKKNIDGTSVGIQDHVVADYAVAEAPTGVARALLYLYIVRASPSFLLYPSWDGRGPLRTGTLVNGNRT